MRWIIALAMIAWTTGCTVGPDYVRPNVDMPDAWRFEDKSAQDTANTEWWKQFQDPVLDALIAEALENNKNIRLATANIEKAAAALVQSRSQLFPQIGYSGSGTRQRATEQGATPDGESKPWTMKATLDGENNPGRWKQPRTMKLSWRAPVCRVCLAKP